MDAALDERSPHHEDHEGHEGFGYFDYELRALRALRGDLFFFFGAAPPTLGRLCER
jgi:hypothetical protein